MKKILEPECGGSNPLTRLPNQVRMDTNHFTPYNTSAGPSSLPGPQNMAPTTFDVHSLLSEVSRVNDSASLKTVSPGPSVVELTGQVWSSEFGRDKLQQRQSLPSKGQDQPITSNPVSGHMTSNMNHHQPMSHPLAGSRPMAMPNFMSDMQHVNIPTASDILSKIDFIQDENEIVADDIDKVTPLVDQWTEEFTKGTKQESDDDMWARLQEQWQNLEQDEGDSYQNWLNDLNQDEEYSFQEENEQLSNSNAFEEGLEAMQRGDTSLAIRLFESVVRADPTHAEAWYNLGNAQSSNEHDIAAISALKKCVEIDKSHLKSYIALSVSYTNDHQFKKAVESLKSWIENNPKYSKLVSNVTFPVSSNNDINFYRDKSVIHDTVIKIFLDAARLSPVDDIDVDIQIGLGILFTISNDYTKAVDCFSSAVEKNPNDAMTWNKLGATYANNGANEKALASYRRALTLQPGYVRTRYNLSITCTNLGAYAEALEQLVSVLQLRYETPHPPTSTSSTGQSTSSSNSCSIATDTIWNTLTMNLSLAGREDLMQASQAHDLQAIRQGLKL